MATDKDLVLRLTNLVGYGWSDVNSDTSDPTAAAGAHYFCHDAFGARILKYVRNRNGSDVVMGELMSYLGDSGTSLSTTVANITSGTTTTAVVTGLTAGNHDGMICYVEGLGSGSGAPEGQSSIVAINSATLITLESSYPFSTSLLVNDDLELIATWQVNDAADGDRNHICAGIVLGRDGITDGNYGWIQKEGKVSCLFANAIVTDEMVVADAARIGDWGGTPDGQELWVGISLIGADDVTLDQVLIDMRLVSHNGVGVDP